MIKKLKEHDIIDPKTDKVIGKIGCDLREIMDKLNELVDAVNTIQKEREAERSEIQEWIGILEAVRKSVNVHEKQIDELQMKVEPEKCETKKDIKKEPLDRYIKQRRWVGKLCKFEGENYGILKEIGCSNTKHVWRDGAFRSSDGYWYNNCEPVKPDSELIYHGE